MLSSSKIEKESTVFKNCLTVIIVLLIFLSILLSGTIQIKATAMNRNPEIHVETKPKGMANI